MPYIFKDPSFKSEEIIFDEITDSELEIKLKNAEQTYSQLRYTDYENRAKILLRTAEKLEKEKEHYARIITEEMGKITREAIGEVEKCALCCHYYAEHGKEFLKGDKVDASPLSASIEYQPLGVILLIMPWNFPLWQVFRCASAAIISGNSVVLKHASNVPQCALAIEEIFNSAAPDLNCLQNLFVSSDRIDNIIADKRIKAVALTGSEAAGRAVAATAGRAIKPALLELGGSDPFVVLEDADLELAVKNGITSRFMNAGQSCIAAKRFIVCEKIADEFCDLFAKAVGKLKTGKPDAPETDIAPLAREDILTEVEQQVNDAVAKGAKIICGGSRAEMDGNYYLPTILDCVSEDMQVWSKEVFGPVATIIRVKDADEALQIANDSDLGLGGSVWTKDTEKGRAFAMQLECGSAFVNCMVRSDPRLPFGGIKESGFGRELAANGVRQFVNIKTVCCG